MADQAQKDRFLAALTELNGSAGNGLLFFPKFPEYPFMLDVEVLKDEYLQNSPSR